MVSWDGLASASDQITEGSTQNGEAYHANTSFERSWQVLDNTTDPWRRRWFGFSTGPSQL